MNIEKYKKLSDGKYKIVFGDKTEMICYEEVIISTKLLKKNDITKKVVDEINKENNKYEAYYFALGHLKSKLRTVKEIEKHLRKKEVKKIDIDYAISILIKEKYLDDNKYVIAYINTQIKTTKHGPRKIKQDLKQLGISEDLITNNINIFDEETKKQKINKYIDQAVKTNRKYGSNLLKRKIIDKLINDGYEKEAIVNILNIKTIEDNIDILKREYEKVTRKEKDEYKIKNKLYLLGFNIENIKEIID